MTPSHKLLSSDNALPSLKSQPLTKPLSVESPSAIPTSMPASDTSVKPLDTPTTHTNPALPLSIDSVASPDLPPDVVEEFVFDPPLDLHGDSFIYGNDSTDGEIYHPETPLEELLSSGKHELVNCFSYSRKTGEVIDEIELDDVGRVLSNNNQFIWLGLHDPSVETVREVQRAFDLHELAIEDAFAEHQRSKVESYGTDTLFFVVRTAKLTENTIRYGTTAIFLGKQYIITIRQGASDSYASVREQCHRRPEKLRLGPIFVLHAILDFIVDNYLPITDKLGRYLREQEREIFSYSFDKQTLQNLYELKSQLVHMRAVILPLQDICNFFLNHKKNELLSTFPSQANPYFRDVQDHVLRALDAVNGLNEMLSVAMDTYMAVVNMGQNEVVRRLAAWAGILAVPTAVAGIYGMNFKNMPELEWTYGYPVVLFAILAVCVYLYYRFKQAEWL